MKIDPDKFVSGNENKLIAIKIGNIIEALSLLQILYKKHLHPV